MKPSQTSGYSIKPKRPKIVQIVQQGALQAYSFLYYNKLSQKNQELFSLFVLTAQITFYIIMLVICAEQDRQTRIVSRYFPYWRLLWLLLKT